MREATPYEFNEISCELFPDGLEDPTFVYDSFDKTYGDVVTSMFF